MPSYRSPFFKHFVFLAVRLAALKRIYFLLALHLVSFMTLAQVINLEGQWKFHIGDNAAWVSPAFNDTKWGSIKVPATWEDEGFNGYDGFAWYRTSFDGRNLNRNETYYINLGFIDDTDEAYLNGTLIGFEGQCPPHFKTAYNNERKYILPQDAINYNGKNTIAVRVFDAMHRGGITDGPIGIYRQTSSKGLLLDLQGIWSFATVQSTDFLKDESRWRNIMVPAPWEFQTYMKYDGYAWYKKTFTIPEDFPDNDLVLLLGKIDDFDKTYLNGVLIGSTNDGRRYGTSYSYQEDRAYNIPKGLLKKKGVNTIEVFVEDMGNIGGIYEGVIGITTKSNYHRYFD